VNCKDNFKYKYEYLQICDFKFTSLPATEYIASKFMAVNDLRPGNNLEGHSRTVTQK